MVSVRISPNLALNELVVRRRASGEDILHLGFGEARLPAFAPLVRRLVAGAHRNTYGPVAGDIAVREGLAGYFTRRRVPTTADQVVVAPGSKPLLMAVQMAVPGDVLLPRPCWNSYAPQVAFAGKSAINVSIPHEYGGIPDPDALRKAIHTARTSGRDPRMVVLTLPDNPTGTLAPPDLVRRICSIAEEENLLILSDEIYRDMMHDPATPVLSPAEVVPERTITTTGLSKSLAIGGWRIGAARFPGTAWGERIRAGVISFASEVWSALASPMQEVAAYAFAEPSELVAYLADCNRLHGSVARAVHDQLVTAGASCRRPTGGFYVYPDFEPLRESLRQHKITDSPSLQRHLLDQFGIAVLAGHDLGDDASALRFKISTGQLYGAFEGEQVCALRATDPTRLPHIVGALTRIEEAITKLRA